MQVESSILNKLNNRISQGRNDLNHFLTLSKTGPCGKLIVFPDFISIPPKTNPKATV